MLIQCELWAGLLSLTLFTVFAMLTPLLSRRARCHALQYWLIGTVVVFPALAMLIYYYDNAQLDLLRYLRA